MEENNNIAENDPVSLVLIRDVQQPDEREQTSHDINHVDGDESLTIENTVTNLMRPQAINEDSAAEHASISTSLLGDEVLLSHTTPNIDSTNSTSADNISMNTLTMDESGILSFQPDNYCCDDGKGGVINKLLQSLQEEDVQEMHRLLNQSSVDVDVSFSSPVYEHMEMDVLPTENNLCMPIDGYSPIHIAAILGNVQVLIALLEFRPDVDKIALSGESALHIACKYGHSECVDALLKADADVNLVHHLLDGDTPVITTVASYSPECPLPDDYISILKLLITHGCDVNTADNSGLAALHIAVTKEDVIMTELLLAAGAYTNTKSIYVMSPLQRAVQRESLDNLKLILKYGCDINAICFPGQTALYLAVQQGYLPAVLELLQAGADPWVMHDGFFPVQVAATKRDLVVLWLLLTSVNGADVNIKSSYDGASLMLILARNASYAGVELMLKLGASPDMDSKLGTTPLWAAVKNWDLDLVSLLIWANCNLNVSSLELFIYRPITAVQLALQKGCFGVAKMLLYSGAKMELHWLRSSSRPAPLKRSPIMQTWLEQWLTTPLSLRSLCRRRIRRCIGVNPAPRFSKWIFPQQLKDYILLTKLTKKTHIHPKYVVV